MKPEIDHCDYWEVDTMDGSFIIPTDLLSRPENWPDGIVERDDDGLNDELWDGVTEALATFLETNRGILTIEHKHGWIGRMSMPGYMDATEWQAFDSEQEAIESLEESED